MRLWCARAGDDAGRFIVWFQRPGLCFRLVYQRNRFYLENSSVTVVLPISTSNILFLMAGVESLWRRLLSSYTGLWYLGARRALPAKSHCFCTMLG